MKKFLLLFTFAFSLFTFAFSQQYAWQDISANIPQNNEFPPSLSDLFFVSNDVGWITSTSYNEIFKTIDGGATFSTQTTPLGATSAIQMVDADNGYAGGQGGWIYKTEDGGINWNILGSIGTLLDISFPFQTNPSDPVG
ncbi:MAG: hypothetical protein C0591_04870 [Marinilabiliales bacterium]|nr:MAG: hypothetical protein C0591_04870 [Marinilabiliales bacterium]